MDLLIYEVELKLEEVQSRIQFDAATTSKLNVETSYAESRAKCQRQ